MTPFKFSLHINGKWRAVLVTLALAACGMVKLGHRDEGTSINTVLGQCSKSEARKLRKALRKHGFTGMAGASRLVTHAPLQRKAA